MAVCRHTSAMSAFTSSTWKPVATIRSMMASRLLAAQDPLMGEVVALGFFSSDLGVFGVVLAFFDSGEVVVGSLMDGEVWGVRGGETDETCSRFVMMLKEDRKLVIKATRRGPQTKLSWDRICVSV